MTTWDKTLRHSHRSIGKRLFQNSQRKGNSSSSQSSQLRRLRNNVLSLGSSVLLVGMASTLFYIDDQNRHIDRACCDSSHHTLPNKDQHHPSSLSPTLPYRILQPNSHLEIAFCTRTRNPIYVLEKDVLYITMDKSDSASSSKSLRLGRNRRPNFFEEKSIPTNMRSRPSDYKHSGWDRGHMAPAADYTLGKRIIENDNQKQQIEEQLAKEQIHTFNLCNISPQDASLNRGLWSKLESWVRKTVVELQEEDARNSMQQRRQVHVLTGPLWMPTHYSSTTNGMEYRYLGIGKPPSLVAVPSHFFKVIVVVDKTPDGTDQIEKFACFVMANKSTQSGDETIDDDQFFLQDFLVPWSTLETVTGLEFFSNLIDDDFRKRADELTLAQVHRRQRQSQAPRSPTLPLLEAGTSKGGGRRNRKDLSTLEHLCKGGKCRV